jgi:uroporphyrinogen decarboxylase
MDKPAAMTPRDRIRATIAGQPVDRPPVSLWRHFPDRDQTAEDLTAATLDWQRHFDFDFVKFMPPGDYPIIDWGGVTVYEGAPGGTRTTKRFPISSPAEWRSLKPVDIRQGFNGMVIDAISATRTGLDPDVPLLHTIFSPLTVAMKLSNAQAVNHAHAHPDDLRSALAVITEVTRECVKASLAAGADGFFFATQCADEAVMPIEGYQTFGVPFDLAVLEAVPENAIVLLHLHGSRPMFDLQVEYPAHIINWHDRRAAPSLREGQSRSGRAVAGGIDERAIANQSPEAVAADVADAVAATGGRGLIVAPGCVIPIDTPEANIHAAVAAAHSAA